VRLAAEPPALGKEFELDGRSWIAWVVEQPEAARDLRRAARYVCTEVRDEAGRLRERSGWLRGKSARLRARSRELREKSDA
jgi:hypothetical protein